MKGRLRLECLNIPSRLNSSLWASSALMQCSPLCATSHWSQVYKIVALSGRMTLPEDPVLPKA